MCGICGIVAISPEGATALQALPKGVEALSKRGPDHQQTAYDRNVGLGHARLSIIDTSALGNQPMTDPSGRYTLVFNGEIFNYQNLRKTLEDEGVAFTSQSDSEVLLHLYRLHGPACLEKLNGFFAFAIYDRTEDTLFLARDRVGIKPLLFFQGEHFFGFASEMKALLAMGIPREIHRGSLFMYLQLNYVPGPQTMLRGVHRILPGTQLMVSGCQTGNLSLEGKQYYAIPQVKDKNPQVSANFYEAAQKNLRDLLTDSVRMRLVADVPLGTFLSGGIDSSVITALAAKEVDHLQTFSIGYKDAPFFDETSYAQLVAKQHGTEHTVFSLSNDDLYSSLHDVLDYLDEPFADSSALAVFILSQHTRKHVTVTLSGDGADEMFSGYNKHAAEYKARNPGVAENLIKGLSPIIPLLPQSRNTKWGNLGRQVAKFNEGMRLTNKERYWRWATILKEEEANYLLKEEMVLKLQRLSDEAHNYKKRREGYLKMIRKDGNLNDVLLADMQLVLPNDMLTKVDLMSMANSLEVRTPFLDHRLVNFAFSLPPVFKINASMRKKILQDTFKADLPEELYNRPKQGFEVPLLGWFRSELRSMIEDDLLNDKFIEEQQIFNGPAVQELKKRLFSANPGDSAATVWAMVVFQWWWKKYMA